MNAPLQFVEVLDTTVPPYVSLPCSARLWISGDIAPPSGGEYERLTPSLGITVDVWDDEYCCWRRGSRHRAERDGRPGFCGVTCANQDLPWRPISSEGAKHG